VELRTSLLGLVLSLALCGSVWANTVQDWSGPYAGLYAGHESGDQAYFDNNLPRVGDGPDPLSGSITGAFAGHNFQFGAWVAGPEGSLASADGRYAANGFNHKRFADLRMRTGYASGSSLACIAVGYSQSVWEEGRFEDLDTSGHSIAIGPEQSAGESFALGAEVMKRSLKSDNFRIDPRARFEADLTAIHLRAGVHF
jgi:hypothetical protein